MNTPTDHDRDDLRYAEYVLGVLDADARAAVEREIHDNPQAAAAVALWQRHLLPLSEDIPAVAPADYVWARLQSGLGLAPDIPAPAPARRRLWDSLPLWRWLGIGASMLAAACLVMLFSTPLPAPITVGAQYMVSSIQQDNGITGWTAAMDIQHAQMVVVPATPAAIAGDRSPELWLIPPGGKPMPLGVIARDKPTTVKLRPDQLANLTAKALLAVSVEPAGGSPTGQPTGPVVAKGPISGA
ncbi:anti-sigma factor [Rhodanobacter sp. DHG33]|uniref:anti-sigma factor n=1 Tax=Rhodanobacter sp. DHG33 TaxID=2775921 RepID=UPI00177ECF4B|nr:anti-sigma factor [Rhodanobacter sp. DHG33]MBD8900228.1 anti-sigma factor [Rhodanobacter sp. DHG33]